MEDYLIIFSVGFVAALTPGPDILFIVREGFYRGVYGAFSAVFGILTGMSLYLSLVAIGVGELGKNPIFQSVVTLFGSIYLLRISYLIYNDESKLEESGKFSFKSENWFSIYKKAILIHLSNPKALIFFTVVITPFLTKSVFLSVLSLFLGIFSAFVLAGFVSSKIPITSK